MADADDKPIETPDDDPDEDQDDGAGPAPDDLFPDRTEFLPDD